jgi:hypothetical protein
MFVVDGVTPVIAGIEFTVAEVVYVALQPPPVPLFTVTVYTPPAVVVTPDTLGVAVVAPVIDTGPAHE